MIRRHATQALAILALAGGLGAGPADAAVRALLVGIDDYTGPPKLRGAVNDIRDLAGVLGAAGIETVVLEDRAATRAAVAAAFRDLAARSAPEDLVYVHFSGHGISIADDDGDETDGRDESYLLRDFDEIANPGEQLVDDDLEALFASVGRSVLFVADACHSGSPARAVSGEALPTRLYLPKAEPLRPPPIAATGARLPGDVFAVGATFDDRSIPEILIDGRPRGALSFAAARAFEGFADRDGDGRVTAGEFELYVRQTVRNLAAAKQTPQFEVPDDGRVFLDRAPVPAPAMAADTGLPDLAVYINDEAEAVRIGALAGVRLVDRPEDASLVFDVAGRTVANAVRDIVATGPQALGDPAGLVAAERVRIALARLAAAGTMTIGFSPGDSVHTAGTALTFTVEGPRQPYLTAFDLTASGVVMPLWPLSARDADPYPADRPFRFTAEAAPPFGGDTLVIVATASEPVALRAALAAEDDRRRPMLVHAALEETLRTMRTEIALQTFLTAPEAP